MDAASARWLPSSVIAECYAVHEDALFRYSQRGMLGAKWDEDNGTWLYDIWRVADLFLHKDHAGANPNSANFGVLGQVALAGGRGRRSPVRSRGIQSEVAGEETPSQPKAALS